MMSLSIDMTLRGVLLAGKWATEAELRMHDDDWWRNGLISKLHEYTKRRPGFNYQAFTNDDLIANGAMVVVLSQVAGYGIDKLKTMSDGDQRNTIIAHNNAHTGIATPVLSGLTNRQLVRLALVE
jgi:hypothetical protein